MAKEKLTKNWEAPEGIPPPITELATPQRSSRRGQIFRTLINCTLASIVFLGLRRTYHNLNSGLEDEHAWSLDTVGQLGEKILGLTGTEHNEKLFLSIPNPQSALAASRAYATHPHLAGSSEDFEDAKIILKLFQSELNIAAPEGDIPVFSAGTAASRNATLSISQFHTGPQAWIDEYYPVLNTPLDRSLQILGEEGEPVWSADLVEDGDPLDPETAKYRDAVPTFHGLSRGGEATGQLIYANYGTKEDYDQLVEAGANLTGKIVITRYGAIFRGLKIKGAEEHGAVGILIYSDPRDDGSVTVENGYLPYPLGPARNPTSVQRGSVQYISIYPGDPTTPGYPAYENSTRSDPSNIPSIPSLPISWSNAERLLEEIGGSAEGNLLSGRASETTIKLVNHVDDKVTPIWNTMATIPGLIKDEVVLVGCHRDAWVMGAADPTSGTVSLHEIIRGFGALVKGGWRPTRTIIFASWDAEEYGLVGSTEWGEDFADWISKHVVTYLNVDVSSSGTKWNVGGSPSLAHLIRRTAQDVPHPTDPERTLWDAQDDEGPFTGPTDLNSVGWYHHESASAALDTGVRPLGSGSDYTVFLQRIGVASSDQGFGGTATDAVYHYHSVYDSQRWQETYADPTFTRHVAVAKNLGLLALRIADSLLLPLNTTQYALELDSYLDKVEDIASSSFTGQLDLSTLRTSIKSLQNASAELDVEKTAAAKALHDIIKKLPHYPRRPHFCKRHSNRVAKWIKSVFGVHDDHRPKHRIPIRKLIRAAKRVYKSNQKLAAFERGFISKEGIKDREWYRHLAVAPGKWLGYGATTLPALTEALTIEKNVTLAEYEAGRLIDLIEKLTVNLAP